ncbi:caspase domain-containing protein [Mycena rosella]|uniref:Caspase domain-containing protein n=1 Tax=Mycena rosella TaxID=1033263 RepID=A0AAD7GMF6_MYCRO|nr:caspase domain-containing protein [Mycena rosella]
MNTAKYSGGLGLTFALVIGIDEYRSNEFGTLRGAVNDARSFERFLMDPHESGGLQVPRSCIKFLENEQATRSASLSAFDTHFLNNQNIPEDGTATMIAYFAGHGSRMESPGNLLPADSRVEVICPVDERTLGSDGKEVPTIPDYVLAQRLQQLAIKKGNNITVILDSCHSGGMKRVPGVRQRCPAKPSSNVDEHIDPSQCYRMWSPSAASHILLAACSQSGKAYESTSDPAYGHFTKSLITALRSAVLKETTYTELMEDLPKLPVEEQIPHCGGAYTHRLVFTKNGPMPGMRTLALRELHMFVVAIGSNMVVREGMEFDVYDDCTMVCTLVARMVTEDQAILASPDGTPLSIPEQSQIVIDEDRGINLLLKEQSSSQAFLIQTGSFEGVREGMEFPIRTPQGETLNSLTATIVGIGQTVVIPQDGPPVEMPMGSRVVVDDWEEKVGIYVPTDFTLGLYPPGAKAGLRYEQAASYQAADLVLRREGNDILVERITGTSIGYPCETRFTLKDPLHLPAAISDIAHFHYFLNRRNKRTLLSGVTLEMYRLRGEYPKSSPEGDNIIKPNGEVYKAELPSNIHAKYGFVIRNRTNQDLFAYIFYFNPAEYVIKPWYAPETAFGRPPLHRIAAGKPGKVTFGIGGERAFIFTLPPGKSSSSGFIKIFVSTEYLDLGWIQQQISPFNEKFDGTGRLEGRQETFRSPDWDALLVVLTMSQQ